MTRRGLFGMFGAVAGASAVTPMLAKEKPSVSLSRSPIPGVWPNKWASRCPVCDAIPALTRDAVGYKRHCWSGHLNGPYGESFDEATERWNDYLERRKGKKGFGEETAGFVPESIGTKNNNEASR